MSFSVCKDNELKYAFNMSDEDWLLIKKDKNINITMPCCGKKAVCKENKDGVKYFDHAEERCRSHADVSLDGLTIKSEIVGLLKQRGWAVESEKTFGKHVADIYAQNNKHKMCIQVVTDAPTVEQLERKDKEFKKHDVKALWLVKFKNTKLRDNISTYNNKANVLSIAKKQGEILIGGFFAVENQDGLDCLGEVQQLELSNFLDVFFKQRRILRHELDRNLLVNFEYKYIKCNKCSTRIAAILHTNVAFSVNDKAVRFARVWYEDVEDKVIFSYINDYSKNKHLGVAVTWLPIDDYGLDDDDEEAVQYCTSCATIFKLKKSARLVSNTAKSPYRPNTRLTYTDIGVKFGAIWILK